MTDYPDDRGALSSKTLPSGTVILCGTINGERVTVWPNTNATPENRQPQWHVKVDNFVPKPQGAGPSPQGETIFPMDDDEIPF